MSSRFLVASLVLLVLSSTAAADEGPLPVTIGGYVQPQFRLRENSAADNDTDGFRFRRARLTAAAERESHGVELGVDIEIELTPEVQLLDGYVTAIGALPAEGTWRVDVGQLKAPFSRQELLSDSRLAFVEKAELGGLAPGRQIGGRLGVAIPGIPMVELWAGLFNGEGRNQVQNIDQNYLWVGRIEVKPIGRDARLAESGFEDHVTLGGSVTRNTLDIGDGLEKITSYGGDAAAAWHGISAAFEMTLVDHVFPTGIQADYQARGIAGHAAYLLPLGGFLDRKLEVGARFEEIDRNDAVPVDNPGDPAQSLQLLTGALSYYHARHDLKAQLTFSHVIEVEKEDRVGGSIVHDNDILLLQVTARME